jgi:hypothetical protein
MRYMGQVYIDMYTYTYIYIYPIYIPKYPIYYLNLRPIPSAPGLSVITTKETLKLLASELQNGIGSNEN